MNKPKIVFLIPWLGIVDRGAEVFIFELSKRLNKDFAITIFVRKQKKQSFIIDELLQLGVSIRQVNCVAEDNWILQNMYHTKLRSFLDLFHLGPVEIEMLIFSIMCFPHLLQGNYDLLYPVNGVWGVLMCKIVGFLRKSPFVYTSVGGIEPLIARLGPAVYITINPGIERWLKKYFPKLRVIFIPTAVDLGRFRPYGKKIDFHLPPPIILTVAALVPGKEVDLTIKAVAKLKRGSLVIVGDGHLKSELVKLAKKCLQNRFLFQSVKYSELDMYYRSADVFAFSAPWEVGWSMVHLEALASGLPVVANKEENLEFLMGEQELLCDVKNSDEYSICLDRASKKKNGAYWRNKVKNYSWEKIAAQYKEVLLGIVNEYKKKD